MIHARFCILYLMAAGGLGFAQGYSGQFTSAACNTFQGTANSDNGGPATATGVDLYSDGVSLGTATSYNAGSNDFPWYFGAPTTVKDNQVHAISAMYSGTSVPLQNSPQSLQCTSTSTGYAYSYTDSFASINPANWTSNRSVSTYPSPGGFNPLPTARVMA